MSASAIRIVKVEEEIQPRQAKLRKIERNLQQIISDL
jgi:hypothetical protein